MFAIYNNGTVGFRSTSDNLYALKNVEELESARFEPKEGLIQNFSNELNKEKKDRIFSLERSDLLPQNIRSFACFPPVFSKSSASLCPF